MEVQVTFRVDVPEVGATSEEVENWLRFELNDNGSLALNNPLINHEVEPMFGSFEWDEL